MFNVVLFQLETAPPPEEFYKKYIKPSRAAIFRNALINTEAFTIWTDEYLKKHYGDLEVRLEGKKEMASKNLSPVELNNCNNRCATVQHRASCAQKFLILSERLSVLNFKI